MQVQEVALRECCRCQGLTNQTATARTRQGKVVTFPCCLKCRSSVQQSLNSEVEEMELDFEVTRKLIAVGLVEDIDLRGRALDNTDVSDRHQYRFVPSAKARTTESKVTEALDAMSLEQIQALLTKPKAVSNSVLEKTAMDDSIANKLLAMLGM